MKGTSFLSILFYLLFLSAAQAQVSFEARLDASEILEDSYVQVSFSLKMLMEQTLCRQTWTKTSMYCQGLTVL